MYMVGRIIVRFIKIYQVIVSSHLGRHCRFYPSCSHYTIGSLEKYGIAKGLFVASKRIIKCNPWGGAGIDMP